ncbi:16163_t:CDS:1, partial [Gigaspora rosea]
ADKTKPTIESPKNPNNMYISKPINIREISDRLESYEIPDDL